MAVTSRVITSATWRTINRHETGGQVSPSWRYPTACLEPPPTPAAWLRPFYARIAGEAGFSSLAPSHHFARLVAAVEPEYPNPAALMREYNGATQRATLGHLQKMQAQQPLHREEPLWAVRKGNRTLRCIIVYLPSGADLRLLEAGEFRRTVLFRDGPALEKRQYEWKAALQERGWARVL